MDAIIGFSILLLVGYLSAYQFKKVFARWAGLDEFLTSGFLFIFIGVFFGPYGFDVLSKNVVDQLSPLIYLALGWIGFIVGIQFEWRLLKHLHKRLFMLAQIESLISFSVLFLGVFVLLKWLSLYISISNDTLWTTSLILAATGAISSSLTVHYFAITLQGAKQALKTLEYIISLHVFIPLVAVMLIFSFFHLDESIHTQLSPWLWLLIHISVGFMIGILIFYLLNTKLSENEQMMLILGSIMLCSGVAAYLHISPIFVCFICGLLLANLPGFNNTIMEVILRHAERPLYLIMLIIAGSTWNLNSPLAWLFLILFLGARLAAKGLALLTIAKTEPALEMRQSYLGSMLAQGPLAIALLVEFTQLYNNELTSYVMTSVLAGAIINEVVAARMIRKAFPQKKKSLDIGKEK